MTIVEEGVSSVYAAPGEKGSVAQYRARYGHYIGGEFVAPVKGEYFEDISPVNGKPFCEVGRGTAEDIDRAVETAWKAFASWRHTSPAERSVILNRIADRIEQNLEAIAVAETWENGKPVRETLAADIPLAVDHFRYFAGVLRAQEGGISQLDENTVAYHFHEPLGVVGQIIPWNFPILMATWKLAPALAAGNCVVLKPAEQTPASILFLFDLIGDLLPAGVVNIVNGFGIEAGAPLASHKRIRKVAFTGETTTGRLIMQYASQNLIPVTLELGGKSPNIFFEDVASAQDAYYEKAKEGFAMFALNQGEVCTCPSRALIQRSIYDTFLSDGLDRVSRIRQGNPLDPETMIGAQASNDQLEKILSYIQIGKDEGAKVLAGGERVDLGGDLTDGYYVAPTVFEGQNSMRIFQEEIFGPVVSVTGFDTYDDAIATANDTLYGLGAGVWSRSADLCYRAGRAIEAGRVWTNTYHQYPAHAAFGGYKQSGIGRENHLRMLDHYQQTKNLLVSYAEGPMGFF
ncbi:MULTISPECIES: acetaldehyde dehydrogenase ExaC [Microbacterium]|uniref:Aldehyde dehydrogenase n=1 Tax=Microbacterium barkeri TaxID=33917 RepID=A0A9W6H4F5_9MICO|nr:aldehyde dehydrogenase family protein [Microbacterium barkeri]MDI6944404.1 aldehyde dehydrogenase family protein [Microbacterium barkeri]MDR6877479.1 aldehyde dehydrogenase [Microbacterium barkeri]GLJ62417.1 aldehyde dehydrogenase [Microbacterium barkeri]